MVDSTEMERGKRVGWSQHRNRELNKICVTFELHTTCLCVTEEDRGQTESKSRMNQAGKLNNNEIKIAVLGKQQQFS